MVYREDLHENRIFIRTFGEFDILYHDESMLGSMGRSYRILELLKYFIAFRDKRLLPESIVNHLFEEKDHNDPKNVLRTQIFRLRKMLEELEEELPVEGPIFTITFEYGYYMLSLCDRCVVDSDYFEQAMRDAKQLVEKDPAQAIERYRESMPVTPPTVKRNRKPKAQSIGVLNSIEPPHIVAIHEKILMPVGTAMTIVAATK